ncbi:HutD family protein [Glutamicibacter sp. JC586]|uniref:HutD family protein n=1 Tax=Glutamicibacter sp. JC586 TaxID=2590552 RepID=UPI0013594192|nr:HutD family protein [Glutamicibacter sp. JC586]
MHELLVVRYANLSAQLWKNGKGVSRTLLSDSDALGEWTWKVSVAEISQSQPYSQYSGIQRIQVALGPGEIDLTIGGQTHRLHAGEHIAFAGDDEVSVAPLGVGFQALNLMFLGKKWQASVSTENSLSEISGNYAVTILVALDNTCRVENEDLARLDALVVPTDASITVEGRFLRATLIPWGSDTN